MSTLVKMDKPPARIPDERLPKTVREKNPSEQLKPRMLDCEVALRSCLPSGPGALQ